MTIRSGPRIRAVPAVTRAIAILRLLSRSRSPLGLKAIAQSLGLVPSTTLHILRALMAEPWFAPWDFLLADRDGELLGFHWTKVHSADLGEVYVLGISPKAQGLGLGNALLIRGLRHLAERGCTDVLLYVDGDNTGARRLYERAGFHEHDLDVQWRLPDE